MTWRYVLYIMHDFILTIMPPPHEVDSNVSFPLYRLTNYPEVTPQTSWSFVGFFLIQDCKLPMVRNHVLYGVRHS